jgi:integrase
MKPIRIPSYRLHKSSGQAIVTLSGRDHYLGPHGSKASQEAYQRLVVEWQANGRQPKRQQTALTIAGMVAAYWEHIEQQALYTKAGKRTSERLCIRVALRPLVAMFGSKPAASFGPLDLITVRRALCDPLPPPKNGEKRRRVHTGPIARSSVNKHVHRVRRAFRWAAAMQLVPASVWDSLRAVEGLRRGQSKDVREPAKVQPAPLRSVVAVLRRVSPAVATMIRLQWLTGMRPGEVIQMRPVDVTRTRAVWIYRPSSHKNEHRGQDREVPLGPKAQQLLTTWLEQTAPTGFLFPGAKPAAPMTEAAYAKAIARAAAAAKAPHWTPHQLRHNAATRIRHRHGLEAAGAVLGHADVATTTIYALRDRQKAIDVAAEMG